VQRFPAHLFHIAQLGAEADFSVLQRGADTALMPLGDASGDGKADAEAACTAARRIGAVKAVEELVQLLRCQRRPADVHGGQQHAFFRFFQRKGDSRTLGGVFHPAAGNVQIAVAAAQRIEKGLRRLRIVEAHAVLQLILTLCR